MSFFAHLTLPQAGPDLSIVIISAGAGLVFGSFVGALSYRLPRGIGIVTDRSRCTSCGHVLAARNLVPVASWLIQRGKCSYCGSPISARYLAIELVSCVMFAVAAFLQSDPIKLALVLALTPPLLALAVIDLEQRRLPNVLIAVVVLLLVLWQLHSGGSLPAAIALCAAVAALIAVVVLLGRRLAPHISPLIGAGDGKLFAAGALGLSLPRFFLLLMVAGFFGTLFGLVWSRRTGESRFPFGPAIAFGLWSVVAADRMIPF